MCSGPGIGTGGCLAALRAGTREAHARLEGLPAMARLLAPDLRQDEYVCVLQHMHRFHGAFEPAIAAGLSVPVPAAVVLLDGTRPAALAADLAWFDVAPRPWPEPPVLDGPAAALGALYVVEGSALGGRVIARQVAASLGVSPGQGGSFYGGQDAEAARRRWRTLCALLDSPQAAAVVGGAGAGAMVAGAVAVFDVLSHWLARIEPAPTPARAGGLPPATHI